MRNVFKIFNLLSQAMVCVGLMCVIPIHAQQPNDTIAFYRKLEIKADEYKSTQLLYRAFFESSQDSMEVSKKKTKSVNQFIRYKGKMVRHINVLVLDPFGYSVNDHNEQPDKIERWGNRYHITTKQWVIKNMLLFEADKAIDPLEISESERLLRAWPHVNDARIYVQTLGAKARDSVDIVVVVQDKWTTSISGTFSLSSPEIIVTEKNFLGLGNQLIQGVEWNRDEGFVNNIGEYSIRNIKKTYITATASYALSRELKRMGLSFDRPFYSPLAKWAAGAAVTTNYGLFKQYSIAIADSVGYDLYFNDVDLWGAKSIPLNNSKTASLDERSSNFIIGARYYRLNHFKRPSFEVDSEYVNRDEVMYLANVGFSHNTYYRDKYLYRFGANEDIPEGFSVEYTQGKLKKEDMLSLHYSGLKMAAGKYFDRFGYLSGALGYGTFYNRQMASMGVVNIDLLYFSDLLNAGKWNFRQFTRYKMVHGIGRESYEWVTINGAQMYGFDSDLLRGKSKMMVSMEMVIYSPYQLIGFRFAPVVSVGFATVGDDFASLFNSRIFRVYSLGIMIRNEYLIMNSFQLSIGLYPYMPGNANYSVKANNINTLNGKPGDFMISKPELVNY